MKKKIYSTLICFVFIGCSQVQPNINKKIQKCKEVKKVDEKLLKEHYIKGFNEGIKIGIKKGMEKITKKKKLSEKEYYKKKAEEIKKRKALPLNSIEINTY